MALTVDPMLVVDPWAIPISCGMASDVDCLDGPIRRAAAEITRLEEHRRAPICKDEIWNEAVLYDAISVFNQ